jgi:hypothetical protein
MSMAFRMAFRMVFRMAFVALALVVARQDYWMASGLHP